MYSPARINPNDFEYLTKSDQEYLHSIERLYLLNSGQLKHFRVLGPWHQVESRQLREIVERVAVSNPRPCSRGHVKGLWCVQDPDYINGPTILKYFVGGDTDTEPSDACSSIGTAVDSRPNSAHTSGHFTVRPPTTPKNKYSIPRKYQVVPKPSPWIIMEPSNKKNFICDDPPDPSYKDRGTKSAKSQRSGASSRPSTCGKDRFVASSVTAEELQTILERIRRPTHASTGGVELVEKYRNKDYVYGSKQCEPDLGHITKPTIASRGGKDIAEKFEKKDYVYGSGTVTPDRLTEIVGRVSRPTTASTGGAGIQRNYTDFVYGDQKVSQEEEKEIVERISKPTVSSRGGVDLKDKKFQYKFPPKNKTNIIIPGLDEKFIGRKKVSPDEMDDIINRLTKLTPAYKAKFAINPHVWKDESARTGPAHVRESQGQMIPT